MMGIAQCMNNIIKREVGLPMIMYNAALEVGQQTAPFAAGPVKGQ